MAMTIRLDPELDDAVRDLAAAQHLSKQQLMERAAQEYVGRNSRVLRTLQVADRIVEDNRELLRRLSE